MAIKEGDLRYYDTTYKNNEFLWKTLLLLKRHMKCFAIKSSLYSRPVAQRADTHLPNY